MSLKLGTIDIASIPASLISTVNNLVSSMGLKLDASVYNGNPRVTSAYMKSVSAGSSSGYIIFSNGYAIQWGVGVKESDGRYSSVTYVKKFLNNNYVIINDCIRVGMTNDGSSWIYSKSETGCRLCGPSGSTRYYIAVGRLASGEY